MAVSDAVVLTFIPVSCVLGLIFAVYLWRVVAKVQMVGGHNVVRSQNGREYLLVSGGGGDGSPWEGGGGGAWML